ncbi:uncharacterized protein B0I36DRAFT_114476 [Microdochium trichocladiopsis]|uniref:Uncharacterized protein n=1 Tax=Microdochium trichocladiopsis TaxID=1682393 RepID=A0A9P9BN28_9PEZI|nr:uncharacterized protein B0I36DRAFT_114476 [Microdochium trichocladiopsis]KAH7030826.1 hypothetical protein B0I36DRAFT_114476 [Microdochium trichocladiopsis]
MPPRRQAMPYHTTLKLLPPGIPPSRPLLCWAADCFSSLAHSLARSQGLFLRATYRPRSTFPSAQKTQTISAPCPGLTYLPSSANRQSRAILESFRRNQRLFLFLLLLLLLLPPLLLSQVRLHLVYLYTNSHVPPSPSWSSFWYQVRVPLCSMTATRGGVEGE